MDAVDDEVQGTTEMNMFRYSRRSYMIENALINVPERQISGLSWHYRCQSLFMFVICVVWEAIHIRRIGAKYALKRLRKVLGCFDYRAGCGEVKYPKFPLFETFA